MRHFARWIHKHVAAFPLGCPTDGVKAPEEEEPMIIVNDALRRPPSQQLITSLPTAVRDRVSGLSPLASTGPSGEPPGPFAVPGLRTLLNLNEYVVHHEDVRRANGLGPRADRPDLQHALWRFLRRGAALQLRKVRKDISVRVRRSDGLDGTDITVGSGPEAILSGEPVELVLFLNGRKGAAEVGLGGDPGAVERLGAADLGI